jgi:type VI protein secretion system component VasF
MKPQKLRRASVFVPETAETAAFDASMEDDARRAGATPGLSAHVQQSRNRNLGISRWLVFAIFLGAVVALAMVQFAVR